MVTLPVCKDVSHAPGGQPGRPHIRKYTFLYAANDGNMLPGGQPYSLAPVLHSLVAGDAAIYDCFPACVDDYKWQLNGGVQSWRALVLLFVLPISLNQVFESNLL